MIHFSIPRLPVTDGPDCDMPNNGKAQYEAFLASLLLKHLEDVSK